MPVEIEMKWNWLNKSNVSDIIKRFKIGLDRGWKLRLYYDRWAFSKKYSSSIVDILCYEGFFNNHTTRDIKISNIHIINRLIWSGLSEPLKFINWQGVSYRNIKEYIPWAANILKHEIPYSLRKTLAPISIAWVEEKKAIAVYKTDPSPRVCVIDCKVSKSIAWYNDFLNSSWIFYIGDIDKVNKYSDFLDMYIEFLIKHKAVYMLLYNTSNALTKYYLDRMVGLRGVKYNAAELEIEKQADPKRYELWKKHFGEIEF